MHVRHERYVHKGKIARADAELELPHSLDERRGLDIAHSSAKLLH